MKKLLAIANAYIQESDWRTIALLKFCLLSLGLLGGILLAPTKAKKTVGILSAMVFACTYPPLLRKLFSVARRFDGKEESLS